MQYSYEIEINQKVIRGVSIEYRYGSIRKIILIVGKRGARIYFPTNTLRDPRRILTESDALVMDAIKKTCLIFTLVNGVSLDVQQIRVLLNGEQVWLEHFDKAHPLVYSMLSGKIDLQDSGLNDPALLRQIANTTKSKYGRAEAALMAFLVAKTRTYRIECFIYLWMSVNAVYVLAMEEAKEHMKTQKKKQLTRFSEKDGLRLLAAIYDMKLPDIRKENEDQVLGHAFSLAKRMDLGEYMSMLDQALRGEGKLEDRIERYDITPEVYEEYDRLAMMLLWLPYQLRCHYFHSENTIPVFCYEDEKLLRGLFFVNAMLERFLSLQLAGWVTCEVRESKLAELARNTADKMVFG